MLVYVCTHTRTPHTVLHPHQNSWMWSLKTCVPYYYSKRGFFLLPPFPFSLQGSALQGGWSHCRGRDLVRITMQSFTRRGFSVIEKGLVCLIEPPLRRGREPRGRETHRIIWLGLSSGSRERASEENHPRTVIPEVRFPQPAASASPGHLSEKPVHDPIPSLRNSG